MGHPIKDCFGDGINMTAWNRQALSSMVAVAQLVEPWEVAPHDDWMHEHTGYQSTSGAGSSPASYHT